MSHRSQIGGLALMPALLAALASAQPVINTVAGSGRSLRGVGGAATGVALAAPYYLALDANDNLYVSDRIYNTVAKIGPNGILTQFAGGGTFGFSGDGGPATQAGFRFTAGITFDAAGNAYIADNENNRVRQITPAGIITTVAGGNCCANNMGDGGPATKAWLAITDSATIGPKGELYIVDTHHEVIRKVDGNGIITTVAGQVTTATLSGIGGYSGDNGPAAQALLNGPSGVVFDSAGNMYICDSGNARIRKVTTGGMIVTFAGGGSPSPTEGALAANISLSPFGIAIDASDNLYVADTFQDFVLRVTPNGIVHIVAGVGYYGPTVTGDGGPATAATLKEPRAVAVDRIGNVYIADAGHQRVRRVDPSGTITTWAGSGASNYGGDLGPALQARLDRPQHVAVDSAGNLLIADVYNNRVRKVDPTGTISTIAGNGGAAYSGDGGQAFFAGLNQPQGVAADLRGNIYIADTGNGVIRKIDPFGVITTFAGGSVNATPCGAPVTAPSGRFIFPIGVAVDQAGKLFIADGGAHCVSSVGTDGMLRTVAGNGVQAFSGDGGPAVNASLSGPSHAVPDNKGGLYIADNLNSRLRYVDGNGRIQTVAGTGLTGFQQPNGPAALKTNMEYPSALALRPDGTLYFTGGASPLLHLTPDGFVYADVPDGNAGFSGDGGPANAASMNGARGLFLDANADLYVTDSQNDRIRKISFPCATVTPGNTVIGPGGAGSLTVSAPNSCSWTISGIPSWLTLSPSSGTGNTTVTYNASAYSQGTVRAATLTVGAAVTNTFTMMQFPQIQNSLTVARVTPNTPCWGGTSGSAGGSSAITADQPRSGNGSVKLTKSAGGFAQFSCTSYDSTKPLGTWGTLTALSTEYYLGSGVAQVPDIALRLYPLGDPRTFWAVVSACSGGVCIAGAPVGSWQALNALGPFQIQADGSNPNPPPASSAAIPSNAPIYSLQVWTPASGGQAWTAFVDNVSFAFNGTGQTFNFELPTPVCTFTLSPGNLAMAAGIGSGSVAVTTAGGCAWTATSNASWLTVTSGNSTIGGGTVNFLAAANPSATARTGSLTIAGQTFTVTQAAGGPPPAITAIYDAWDYSTGIAPGAWVTISGTNMGPAVGQIWNLTGTQLLPTSLGGVTVTFASQPAALLYASATQVNALVPAGVAPGPVQVIVQSNGVNSSPFTISATGTLPSIYAPPDADGSTFFVTAALQGTAFLVGNSATDTRVVRAAQPGDILDLYMIGVGATADPSKFVTNRVFAGAFPVSAQVTATVGGEPAPVLFAGLTSPGLYLVRIAIPSDLGAGLQAIQVSAGGVQTRSSLTLAMSSASPNLMQNGSFESALTGTWQFANDGSTGSAAAVQRTAATAVDGGYAAEIGVPTPATHTTATSPCLLCAVQFWQTGLALRQGEVYMLQFWAKADTARTMQVNMSASGPPYQNYGFLTTVALGGDWQRYVFYFRATATDPSGRLTFYFGDQAGNTWLDNLVLQ